MKTKAVRLYGKKDLKLDEFELPEIKDDEILAKVVSDSLCMSSYKAAKQGADHKRIPDNVAENPVMVGHEFCGEIVEVGEKWSDQFTAGQKFSIQPALNYKGSLDAPGYSFKYIGGDATYIVIPSQVMEMDCLLDYEGDAFFYGSLAEPMSCIVGAFNATYHTQPGSYEHEMGIVEGGNMAILAGAGPMGLGAIEYAVKIAGPGHLVVTDIDDDRLARAREVLSPEEASSYGVELEYVNPQKVEDPIEDYLLSLVSGGYDDVFVYAPVRPLVEQADAILGRDGCLNFFAGPTDPDFKAEFNFYDVHYNAKHIVGTSGGNSDDMRTALKLMGQGKIDPAAMITHIGGLNSVVDTTLNLPDIPGGKKLIYTHVDLELTALNELEEKGQDEPLFAELADIVQKNNGVWCAAAEKYLLQNAPRL
ncbi:MAG: zinc-binding dehydrogenase [Halanaerobiaceae bacterium]